MPPTKYECETCGKSMVRLFRESSTFLSHQELTCLSCAKKRYPDAKNLTNQSDSQRTNIGWLVLAVPDILPGKDAKLPKGYTFWGYSSVPQNLLNWWFSLPIEGAK